MKKKFESQVYPKDIIFKCEKKIAYNSLDHLYPRGTSADNSINSRFNSKFYRLYSGFFPLKVLDLGCSGGGFVRECIDDGCFAIGLEGSDYSKKMKRAEWAIIPEFLYTCDITKNFSILDKKKKIIKFHLITTWEVLEHIEENQIDRLIENIKKHLLEEGIFIASVTNLSDQEGSIEYHRLQKNKGWWLRKFREYGFYDMKNFYSFFNTQYIRGKYETDRNFHLILSLNPKKVPHPPQISMFEKITDKLRGGRFYLLLKSSFKE